MTDFPTNRDLAQKIDELPDKLIPRFDDRYLKISDAQSKFDSQDKRFYTRLEGRAVNTVIGLVALALGVWSNIKHL